MAKWMATIIAVSCKSCWDRLPDSHGMVPVDVAARPLGAGQLQPPQRPRLLHHRPALVHHDAAQKGEIKDDLEGVFQGEKCCELEDFIVIINAQNYEYP